MVNRGEIWWASLSDPVASEPGFKRPILIIQSNAFNHSRIHTVVAIAITSNLRLAAAPGNVILGAGKTGLKRKSVANVSQILTIDKQFLQKKCGKIDWDTMHKIEDGIRLVVSL